MFSVKMPDSFRTVSSIAGRDSPGVALGSGASGSRSFGLRGINNSFADQPPPTDRLRVWKGQRCDVSTNIVRPQMAYPSLFNGMTDRRVESFYKGRIVAPSAAAQNGTCRGSPALLLDFPNAIEAHMRQSTRSCRGRTSHRGTQIVSSSDFFRLNTVCLRPPLFWWTGGKLRSF